MKALVAVKRVMDANVKAQVKVDGVEAPIFSGADDGLAADLSEAAPEIVASL